MRLTIFWTFFFLWRFAWWKLVEGKEWDVSDYEGMQTTKHMIRSDVYTHKKITRNTESRT